MTEQILASNGFRNSDLIVSAAAEVGLPLWVAAAMIEKETGGYNVYGNDSGGIFSTPGEPDIEVTQENYAEFERRVLGGERSNGVGPAQITWPGFIKDAHEKGIPLWDPRTNMVYGFNLLKGYLKDYNDDSIRYAGTRYNGASAYGDALLQRALFWKAQLDLQENLMALPRNTGTPAAIARLEAALRKERPEWDVTCGPSMAGTRCVRGKHGHLWNLNAQGQVVSASTHYVDSAGGFSGRHVGGALDLSQDPPGGGGISVYEQARADDLTRELLALGYGVIWGVAQHFDHPHVDYRAENTNVVYQGPNAGFTVGYIKNVQLQLSRLIRPSTNRPYYEGVIDGLREDGTKAAIKAVQDDAQLKVDAVPGGNTMAAVTNRLVAQSKPAPAPPAPPVQKPAPSKPKPSVPVTSVSGRNRYETAVAISRERFTKGADIVYLAQTLTDDVALAAGFNNGPVLLTAPNSDKLPSATLAEIKRLKPKGIVRIGAVSDRAALAAGEAAV